MADSKVTALTEDTSVLSTDLGYTVEDPAGTPVSKKATWLNILKGAVLGLLTSDGDLLTRTSGAAARLTRADLAADSAFTGAFAPLNRTLGYAQATSNQGSITSETDLTGLSVTVTVPSGRRIRITGHTRPASTANGDIAELHIKESTTVLALDRATCTPSNSLTTLHGEVILTPSAGSHTYKLSMLRDSGSGTITSSAGATFPAFILVEDIGT